MRYFITDYWLIDYYSIIGISNSKSTNKLVTFEVKACHILPSQSAIDVWLYSAIEDLQWVLPPSHI